MTFPQSAIGRLTKASPQELTDVIRGCNSISEVLDAFGCHRNYPAARKYVSQFVKQHELTYFMNRYVSSKSNYDIDDVISAVGKSLCTADVIKELGLKDHGANYKTIKKLIKTHNIDISHFDLKQTFKRNKKVYTFEEIFCINSVYSRSSLSKAAKKYKLFSYECVQCNNDGIWLGQPLPLVLDHINGVNDDNRVDNLRYLCHNCHALTTTFAGRNKKTK